MRFYILKRSPDEKESAACTESLMADGFETGEAPRCEACGRPIAMRPWLPPHRVELETRGRCFGDLVSVPGGSILVSDKFKQMTERERVTGFEGFDPVEVVSIRKHKKFEGSPPQYYRVSVKRSQAAIDKSASGFVLEHPEQECCICRTGGGPIRRWERLVLEPGTWGGEDIFVARGDAEHLCAERFKRVCELAELQNVVFVPADEYWGDFYPSKNFEKAREIMNAPLGPTLLEKVKRDGDTWRWDTKRNYMIAITPNGTLRWITRPVVPDILWNEQ
jgi:hypothetical protein